MPDQPDHAAVQDSRYSHVRMAISLALMTVGGMGMYTAIVALKPLALEFGVSRGAASLPYTVMTLGFGVGGILLGRWSDRAGIMWPSLAGTVCLSAGMLLVSVAGDLWQVVVVHGVLIGLLGTAAFFAPLVADITHWFTAKRGMAVAVVISGNYVAGVIWPPVVQHLIDADGWRSAYRTLGMVALCAMIPLAMALRRRPPPWPDGDGAGGRATGAGRPLGMAPLGLQCLLCVAGIGCCVAMAMPQVHIVAHATDLGHSAVRGAEMLALMLAGGVVSRLTSGWISDRIGGMATLVLGSLLQMLALIAFLGVAGLAGLYLMSALFGLSQGGIVPSYTIIIRTYFPAAQAGWRVGTTMMFTLTGMALGGWMAGVLYDFTGSYDAAFVNAIGFNVVHLAIALTLLARSRRVWPAVPA